MTIAASTESLATPPRVLGLCLLLLVGCPSADDDTEASDTEATATATMSTSGTSSGTSGGSNPSDDSSGSSTASTTASTTENPSSTGLDSADSSGSDASTADPGSESSGCGDTNSDPNNCGECGNVCGGTAHGEATCESGECAVDCDGGFDAVDVGGEVRCSLFAGFFLLRETQECEAPNPFTGDCTCPQGFDDRPVTSWRVQPGDGGTWVQLAACSPIAGDPADSWGGMFARFEGDGACAFPNPMNVPLCACPAGYSVASEWLGANINNDAIRISYCTNEPFEDGAMFTGGFTNTCNGGCEAGATCSCPAGSTAVEYPTVLGNCSTTSTYCYDG